MFIITTAWYLGLTIITGITQNLLLSLEEGSQGQSLVYLIQYANIFWGPIFDVLVIIWMIASAQARDVESEYYR